MGVIPVGGGFSDEGVEFRSDAGLLLIDQQCDIYGAAGAVRENAFGELTKRQALSLASS